MAKDTKAFKNAGIGILFFLTLSKFAFADAPAILNQDTVAGRFQQLEAKIASLQKEVESLRRQVEIEGPQGEEKAVYLPPTTPAGPKWLEGLAMGWDLRLRYEAFEQNEATRDRNRFRYRLRWKITKEISKDLELGFRLVSGSNADPTSTNQTLTGDFTFKDIFVDQVYVKYRPEFLTENIPGLEQAEIGGGKFENPFSKASSTMVWDADVTPEGAYESLEFGLLQDRVKPFVTLGQFLLAENASSTDAELYGVQGGVRWVPPGFSKEADLQLTHAVAYYDYSDYAIDSNFLVGATSLARGNTRTGAAPFLDAGDFDILQLYNEVKFKVGQLPVKLFSDFAANLADRNPDPLGRDIAYEYGIRLGNTKKKRDWEASYYYAYIESNAVVGAFAESDFGLGHANKRGSAAQLKYQLTDSLKLGFTAYFVNNVTGADDETRRFQTDLYWVF